MEPTYDFWQWFSNENHQGAEPDVVLYSEETALIIEAKNYSGKSGSGVTELNEKNNEQPENNENKKVIIDQLAREFLVGLSKILKKVHKQSCETYTINKYYVIFVTRHTSFPREEIEESIQALSDMKKTDICIDPKETFYWINWQNLIPIFEEIVSTQPEDSCNHKIASELLLFLEKRGLGIFSGFRRIIVDQKIRDEMQYYNNKDFLFYKKIVLPYWTEMIDIDSHSVGHHNMFYNYYSNPYWDDVLFMTFGQLNTNIFYMEGK